MAATFVKKVDLHEAVWITDTLAPLEGKLLSYAELGFDLVSLHNVNLQQEGFIEGFAGMRLQAVN